jgi:glycosyltransferase involved in cell wall biosynthesis
VLSILCVTPAFPTVPGDRQGNYVYHSLQALTKLGVEVSVIVTQPYVPSLLKKLFGKPCGMVQAEAFAEFSSIDTVRHLSIPRNYARPISNSIYDARCARAIRQVIQRRRFDLIHAHKESTAPAVVQAARAAGMPALVTLHGIDMCPRYMQAPAQRARFRTALNAMDRVILVGEPLRAAFAALAQRDEHFGVVPNGFFPPSAEIRAKSEARPRLEGRRTELISVSNLHEGKGIDVNLDALARLSGRGLTGWRYRVVGDGDQRSALEAKARALGLAQSVEFLGARPHDEVYALLSEADVFILPSYREAFGIAYVEAMALGLLAVGVRGQGPEAFVRDGETGFLVPPRDAEAVATCLQRVFTQSAQCREMATRGRSEVWDHWTWESHARHLIGVYEEVLRREGA